MKQMWGAVKTIRWAWVLALLSTTVPALAADVHPGERDPGLDAGYRSLYNLDFHYAQQQFSEWEREHADNPMGPVSEAAGLLFSEFQRLGVLESQFYENDTKFQARSKLSPDPQLKAQFDAALQRGEGLAHARLAKNQRDRDALFALTLSDGLKSDYAALIEKRNFESLHYTKEATRLASQLLAVDPQCYDAHLAIGVSNYIIGSMAAPVRWLVRLGGISADKQTGMKELQLTADRGQYLAPFARLLLAIAYVRDKDKAKAQELLAGLQNEFPRNPLFAHEIARLQAAK
jgi:hypothetical protein